MGLIIKGISGVYQGEEIGGVFEELIGGTEKMEANIAEHFKERCISFKPEVSDALKLILEKTTGGEHEATMGSFRDFNNFREKLSEYILGSPLDGVWNNLSKYEGKPFIEFIDFVDDSGCMCYAIAEKLHKDCVDNAELFKTKATAELKDSELDSMLTYYNEFTKACEAASDHGILIFQ